MLFSGDGTQVIGTEELDEEKTADTKQEKDKKNKKYRLVSPAIVADIHYFPLGIKIRG